VADTVPEERRPRAYALLGVANAIGWIAGPVIGAGLSTFGYPVLFGISGLFIGAYVPILIRAMPETRPVGGGGRPLGDVDIPASVSVTSAPVTSSVPVKPTHEAADLQGTRARSERRPVDPRLVFGLFLPILALVHGLEILWVITLPIHAVEDLGIPTPVWGLLFGLNGLLIVLLQLRLTRGVEARSKPRVLALATGLYGLGLGLVAFLQPATAVVGLAATIVLVTLGEMLTMPVVPAFAAELSPVARRGTYQGLSMAAGGLGAGLIPPIAGALLDAGAGATLWLGIAGLLWLAGVALLGLARIADRVRVPDGPSERSPDGLSAASPGTPWPAPPSGDGR
jgi:MFS family permease